MSSEREKFIADMMISYGWSREEAEEVWSKSQLFFIWIRILLGILAVIIADILVGFEGIESLLYSVGFIILSIWFLS